MSYVSHFIFICLCISLALQQNGSVAAQPALLENNSSEDVPLIPRDILFGEIDAFSVMLSPDGSRISYLAPANGATNIWVGPIEDLSLARPVTNESNLDIFQYHWAYTNQHLLYLQDANGDTNWQIFSVNLSSGKIKNLTESQSGQAIVQALSFKYPQEIIVGMNDRNPGFHDLYRLNIETGDRILLMQNDQFHKFYIDDDYIIRFASELNSDAGEEVFERTKTGDWRSFAKIGWEDELTVDVLGFDRSGSSVYMKDSRDRNTAAIYSYDTKTRERKLVLEDPRADLGGRGFFRPLIHPTNKTIQAVAVDYDRINWSVLDPSIKEDMKYLQTVSSGDFFVESRSLDDNAWTVAYMRDDGPLTYYYYDRKTRTAKYLLSLRESLESFPLAKMIPVIIKSRDGLDLVSYYSLPVSSDSDGDNVPDRPLPMVVFVHGGPEGRDFWGYNPIHQLLANRGYAVLSINFRGSTGFGKNFTNAAKLEYGRKMQYDLLDGVDWAVRNKIADPDRIGIMGGSYGGYAALAGLAFSPDVFACGVDMSGWSNLTYSVETTLPYSQWDRMRLEDFVGDLRTEGGRKMLAERSPINYADCIKRPLLISHGANDPIIDQNESAQMVQALVNRKVPVTFLLFPDEGHDVVRPKNNIALYAVVEAFFASHLGGRFEPVGADLKNSSMIVPVGADEIPGLDEALAARDKT
ncbi:MAG: Acylamino-acid-releasing enzyme [Methanosaeta sp. PtaB.Bin039]|nr:MAG: Acylamino-acid-releasing enzyme [Methanosaeta sp. PtaB.Bin039]